MQHYDRAGATHASTGVSTKLVAGVVIILVLVAAVAGYYLILKPGSTGPGSSSTSGTQASLGFAASNPVSATQLYNFYGLGGIPADYKPFTNHTIWVSGNLTSMIDLQKPQPEFGNNEVMTGVNTGGNDFEYWYWGNTTGLPAIANNERVVASCFDPGLRPYGNGSSILYLVNCALAP